MKKTSLAYIVVTLFCLQTIAQVQPVTVPGSELRTFNSKIINQEYVLHIQVPAGYATSTKKYPVVYLMDSQWDFALLAALYGEQYYDGFIPETIIVGVTWGGPHPNPDSLRTRDYTPTKQPNAPQSGGAPAFLSFMKNELFPFIESNYKADKNNRSLMGCSLGGLFTLFALFTEPGLFQGYVAASPAIGWDNGVLFNKYEKEYFAKNPTAPAQVYISMGGVERGVPDFEKFVKLLTDRNYKNIHLKTRVLENIGHSGTKGEGYERGLQYIYERPSLTLAATVLNKYAGSYGQDNRTIDIKNEDNHLAVYFGPNNKFILYAASETDFYATSQFLNVKFKVNGDKVDGFEVQGYGGNPQFIPKK
jgi:predicted alpha/beta superfamily hydrolase